MSHGEFAECINVLEASTGKPFTESQVEVWYRLLGDLTAKALQSAIMRALLESEFPGLPAIGKLRRMAVESTTGIPASADEQFARVRQAISRHGYCDPASARKFLGEDVWAVVEGTGGWLRYCDSPIDQRGTLVAQFVKGWERRSEADERDRRLPQSVRPRRRVDAPAAVTVLSKRLRVVDHEFAEPA